MRSISKGQENKYKDFEPKLVELGKMVLEPLPYMEEIFY
jgi:hypothetical protein